jgi:hypothetical protein
VGGGANDTLKGNGGADSLSGGAGNDGITAGGGADTVTAGLGIDTIALAETSPAADVVQITAGALGTAGDNDAKFITNTSASAVDDRGEITLSGFDAGLDTLSITATLVADFNHTTDLLVSAPAASGTGTNANNVDSFVANTLFIALDGDAAVNDSDDIVVTFSDFKLSGVNQLGAADLLTAADIDQSIVYNITAAAGATAIVTGDLADTIVGAAGVDTISVGAGADTITIGDNEDLDVISLGAADGAADNIVLNVDTNPNDATDVITINNFEAGLGTDTLDIGAVALKNGSVNIGAGVAATNTIAAVPVVNQSNNGGGTTNGAIFAFNGAGDQLAANTTAANSVARAVTALTSSTDFSSAGIKDAGDKAILIMDDNTNSFIFHYIAAGTLAITEAGDLQLLAVVNGVTADAFAAGDLI